MLHRCGPCRGLTLFRWGRRQVVLWYAPADFSPAPHTHDDSDCEFTILWARHRRIYRRTGGDHDEYIAHTPGCWGRFLSVRAGTPHGFDRGTAPMIWLGFETWKPGVAVSSITEDFHPA